MKKLAAIFFIAILVFNWWGYRLVMSIWEEGADKELEVKLDNNEYDERQLLEIKIPIQIPYLINDADFERHYGEIEIEGRFYSFVKRKVKDGFLILKCIPNSAKEQIKEAGNDYFKKTSGLATTDKKQTSLNFAKNFWSIYDFHKNEYPIRAAATVLAINLLKRSLQIQSIYLSTPDQPPEILFS